MAIQVVQYILAPYPRWSARNLVGNAAAFARLFTYQNKTRIPKETFSDPSGLNPNTNPVRLDGKGEANIYWATDELYTIELYDIYGNLILSQDNYPTVQAGGNNDITITPVAENFVRNPQFTFWSNTTQFTTLSTQDVICDDWMFERSNTNATVQILRQTFNLGQTDVPSNPVYYLNYQCNNVGAGGELDKKIYQSYSSVQTLSNQPITLALYAKSETSSDLVVELEQNFGTGGTPSDSVKTTVMTIPLVPEWMKYSQTITLPSVSGKSLGSNGNDALLLNFKLPLNTIASIDIANVQMQIGTSLVEFIYLTQDDQYKRLNSAISDATFKTGDVKFTLRNTSDTGWVLCDDNTIGNAYSGAKHAGTFTKALFELLWTNVDIKWAPILNSDGTTGTKGTSAENDFNANKRLTLTRSLGRTLAAAGTGQGLTAHVLGEYFGEEKHTMSIDELVSHNHSYSVASGPNKQSGEDTLCFTTLTGTTTGATGNGHPFNVIQPTTYLNCMIKL